MSIKRCESKNIVLVYKIIFTVYGQLVLDASFVNILGKIISDAYFK